MNVSWKEEEGQLRHLSARLQFIVLQHSRNLQVLFKQLALEAHVSLS